MPPGIRHQIAARRAETRSFNPTQAPRRNNGSNAQPAKSSLAGGDEYMEDRTVASQIRRAAKSGPPAFDLLYKADRRPGKLDISAFSLDRIPARVYTDLLELDVASLSRPPIEKHETPKEDRSEPEELVGLKASNNEIRELDLEIGAFGGLKSIDVRFSDASWT